MFARTFLGPLWHLSGTSRGSFWAFLNIYFNFRWNHAECDSIATEEDAEKCSQEGYNCPECRPIGEILPHLIKPNLPQLGYGNTGNGNASQNSGNNTNEFSSYSHYNSASFIVDGVILSERGMTCLKQQTVEREKTRRRRKGIGGEGYDPMNPNDPGGSDDDKVKTLFLHVFFGTHFVSKIILTYCVLLIFLHIRGRSLRICNKFAQ